MKIIKLIARIIALPFYAVYILIFMIRIYLTHLYCYLVYGGESIVYAEKFNGKHIMDIIEKLDKKL